MSGGGLANGSTGTFPGGLAAELAHSAIADVRTKGSVWVVLDF